MGADELQTLLNIYLNPEYEEETNTPQNPEEDDIDVERFIEKIIFKIEKTLAERRLLEGEIFNSTYNNLILHIGEQQDLNHEYLGELSYGFRHKTSELSAEEQAELEADRKKLAIIRKITDANECNRKG